MDPIARVLIVDDEVEQATAPSATLEEQGYETHAVPSAAGVRLLRLTRELLQVAKPGRGPRR
jgi:CheY-like chemotaxis protein